MFFKRMITAAAVLLGQGVIRMDSAAGQSPRPARRPAPGAHAPAPAGLSSKAAFMYNCIKDRPPTAQKWQRIPWLDDCPEAIRQAKAENRPLLLWVADEDPLERC